MNIGTISMRYARALLAFATEQGVEDAIYKNMSQLVYTLDNVKVHVRNSCGQNSNGVRHMGNDEVSRDFRGKCVMDIHVLWLILRIIARRQHLAYIMV